MTTGAVGEHVAITLALHLFERIRRLRFFTYRLFRRNVDVRISIAALLRISEGGRYLLVRNLHRPEVFAPFGGVCKYHEDGKPFLDTVYFRPQDVGRGVDMKNDLRGILPGKCLAKLMKWYNGGTLRETSEACLVRELKEELSEIGLLQSLRVPEYLELRSVRVVTEGPEKVAGLHYRQYRLFQVFDISLTAVDVLNFRDQLFFAAASHPDLLIVNADEIITGRAADRRIVASHTAYLLGRKRVRPDQPPLV